MRGLLKFLLSLIVILAIAWLGFWWYAQGRLQSAITGWATAQATQGWKISYDSIARGTSPLRAQVTLTNLVLTPPPDAAGEAATITLPSFALRIEALNPLLLHTDFPSKITVAIGQNVDVALNLGSVISTELLDPDVLFNKGAYPYRSGNFAAGNVDVLASQGSLLVLHIDNFASHYSFNPAATSSAMAITSTIGLDNASLSPLFTRLASIPFGGQITHLALGLSLSGPVPDDITGLAKKLEAISPTDEASQQKILVPVLRKWAAQGGNGNLALTLAIGPSTANADATIKFDPNLQPGGAANFTADHLDAFAAAILSAYPQLQNQVNQVLAQLTPYITSSDTTGQTLGVHLIYGPPGITVNGQKVADMPPVDWNALENAPPPPATAPGDGSGAAVP